MAIRCIQYSIWYFHWKISWKHLNSSLTQTHQKGSKEASNWGAVRLKIFLIFFFQPFGNLARAETFGLWNSMQERFSSCQKYLGLEAKAPPLLDDEDKSQLPNKQGTTAGGAASLSSLSCFSPRALVHLSFKSLGPRPKECQRVTWQSIIWLGGWLVGWLGAFQSCSTLPGWQWNITWLGCALRADIWVKTKGTSEWSVLWKVFFCGIQEKKKLARRHFTN